MTLSEFKAWFEGYTEGLEAAPTKAQFDRIKEKVKLIDGAPITQTVYVDRYVRDLPYNQLPYWVRLSGRVYETLSGAGNFQGSAVGGGIAQNAGAYGSSKVNAFDSHSAMRALGKAEAAIN